MCDCGVRSRSVKDGTLSSLFGRGGACRKHRALFSPDLFRGLPDAALSPHFHPGRTPAQGRGKRRGLGKVEWAGESGGGGERRKTTSSPPPGRRCREAADEGRAPAPQRVFEWPLPRPPLTLPSPRWGRGGACREHRTLFSPDLFRGLPDAALSPAFTSTGPRHKAGEIGVGPGETERFGERARKLIPARPGRVRLAGLFLIAGFPPSRAAFRALVQPCHPLAPQCRTNGAVMMVLWGRYATGPAHQGPGDITITRLIL